MKTIIATTAIALSFAAPAFANSAQAFFALNNDSSAERIVNDTTAGDTSVIELKARANKDSAAERTAPLGGTYATRSDNSEAQVFFSMFNDSAAEIK